MVKSKQNNQSIKVGLNKLEKDDIIKTNHRKTNLRAIRAGLGYIKKL